MFVNRLVPSVLFSARVPAMSQPRDTLSVVPFLNLARELAALFLPVHPSNAFRADLERSLVAAARQQNSQLGLGGISSGGLSGAPRFDAIERRWVIGAAAVGSAVSIAGIVAYVWRRRGDRAA